MKLLIKSQNSPKMGQKWNFTFFGETLSVLLQAGFSFQALHHFRQALHQCRLTQNQNLNLFWKTPNGSLKLPKKTEVVIIIKNGWKRLLGQKSYIWDINHTSSKIRSNNKISRFCWIYRGVKIHIGKFWQ